jgi:phosphate-selective porin OprO and OprP
VRRVGACLATCLVGCTIPTIAAADEGGGGSAPSFTARLFLDHARYRGMPAPERHLLPTSLRLGVEGELSQRSAYELVLETAGAFRDDETGARLRVATLDHRISERIGLSVGQHDEPFSLESFGSAENTMFMERALPSALVPVYHAGVLARYETSRGGAAAGAFGRTIGPGDADRGRGVSARLFATPIRHEPWLVHLGGSLAVRSPSDREVRVRSRPESAVTEVRLVDTGAVSDVGRYATAGLEAVVQRGPTTLQAETVVLRPERPDGGPRTRFDGYYVSFGHFLTGESRRFDRGRGVWREVVPSGDRGAVELALRVSHLDLGAADVQGGVQRNRGIGLNWYPKKNLRLMANYIRVRVDRSGDVERPAVLQLRFQVAV